MSIIFKNTGQNGNITIRKVTGSADFSISSSYASTASYALTASYISGAISINTGSLATTGSNQFSGSQVITGSLTMVSGSITGSLFGTASFARSASFAQTASFLINTVYDREIHVSNISGDDSGSGTLLRPFKTITKAFQTLTSNGSKVIIHPGTYQESPTLTAANATISSPTYEQGGICFISGSLTINNDSTSNRIAGITCNDLIISGSGNLYLDNCRVNRSMVKPGTAYTEILDCGIQPTLGITLSGAGTTVFNGGNIAGITQTNASAITLVKNAMSLTFANVMAGTFAVTDSPIYSLTSGSAAIQSSAGTVVQLFNSQVATLTGIPERVSIGGFFGYDDISFNRVASTLGTSLNLTSDFQTIRATTFQGTASLALTASFVSGSVSNIPDPFSSTAPVRTIVSLTQAEYTALGTKDTNTLYITT